MTVHASVRSIGEPVHGMSDAPSVSANGRFVAFESFAADFVAGDTNLTLDVFVRDLAAGTNALVSVRAGGGQSNGFSARPALSASGRTIAFFSLGSLAPTDTNLDFDVYAYTDWALHWR